MEEFIEDTLAASIGGRFHFGPGEFATPQICRRKCRR
jgi:hypothetical protein